MRNELFRSFGFVGCVKRAISIDAVVSIFKKYVSKDIFRFVMHMSPHQRDRSSIILLKRITTNRTTIGTFQIVLSDIPTKIVSFCPHFEGSPFVYFSSCASNASTSSSVKLFNGSFGDISSSASSFVVTGGF